MLIETYATLISHLGAQGVWNVDPSQYRSIKAVGVSSPSWFWLVVAIQSIISVLPTIDTTATCEEPLEQKIFIDNMEEKKVPMFYSFYSCLDLF